MTLPLVLLPPSRFLVDSLYCLHRLRTTARVCLSIWLFVCLSNYLYDCSSVCPLSSCLSIYVSIYLYVKPQPNFVSLHLSICLYICLYVYMSICLSALCLSFYVPVCLYVRVSTCLLSVSAPDCLSASVSVSLSLRLSLYVSLRMSVCLYLHPFFRFTNLSSRVRPLRIPSFPSLIPLYLLLQPLPPLPPLEPSQPPLRSFALRSTGSPRPVNRLSCAQLPSTVKPIEDLIFDPRCT